MQTFLDDIDKIFDTIRDFQTAIDKQEELGLSKQRLLNLNEVVIQSINVFGVMCATQKKNRKLLTVGRNKSEERWANLSEAERKRADKYGQCIEAALSGEKLKLYPLIQKTQQQMKDDINAATVNSAYSELIGGSCSVHKRADHVRSNPAPFDYEHEKRFAEQTKKESLRKKSSKPTRFVQPQPRELIAVSGVQNMSFQNMRKQPMYGNDDDDDCKMNLSSNTTEWEVATVTNTFLEKAHSLKKQGGLIIPAGTPALVVADHGEQWDIRFARPFDQVTLRNVSITNFCHDSEQIKQQEREHMKEHGVLGYKSLLTECERNNAIGYQNMMSTFNNY